MRSQSGLRGLHAAALYAAALCLVMGGLYAPGCSWTFDGDIAEVALVGTPPDSNSFPRLNKGPVSDYVLMNGADDQLWVALSEIELVFLAELRKAKLRLIRVGPDDVPGRGPEEMVTAKAIVAGEQTLFLVDPADKPEDPTQLTLHRPGSQAQQQRFSMPGGERLLLLAPKEVAFLYWVLKKETAQYQLLRSDGSYQRTLPLPKGLDPLEPFDAGTLFFDPAGEYLYTQDADGRVMAHATTAERDFDLGVRPQTLFFDSTGLALITCGPDGLRRVPRESAEIVLDPTGCDESLLRQTADSVVYRVVDEIRQVSQFGGAPPQALVFGDPNAGRGGRDVGQILSLTPEHGVLYSLDPPVRYGNGIGDGWLGDWRFMERGRRPSWGRDGVTLRWLEYAAARDGVGELRATDTTLGPGAEPLHLARNVRQYSEQPDGRPGRILALANAAFRGPQNRLILIDEPSRSARWVADSARAFNRLRGTSDLLVQFVVGQLGYDLRRVPVPVQLSEEVGETSA